MDTVFSESIGFNPALPTLMHIDLNSCFATVEQQANPLLRGKPVAVAAYTTGNGCILAASREAKQVGVATGMRVRDGRTLCPHLVVLPSDPAKYRFVNRKLLALFRDYTSDVEVKSIDEMVLDLAKSPALTRRASLGVSSAMLLIGREIKRRIKEEIGEWLTVSVGISTNRFLAKTASGLHKPDGLDLITRDNIIAILSGLKLTDLCGIKKGNGGRLTFAGITTALAFYRAPIATLKLAFRSVVGYHWWLRLHGWEADDREFDRKSFGHSYALYKPYETTDVKLHQILCQLVEKMGYRLREHGYTAQGIHVACLYSDYTYWHHSQKLPKPLYASRDLFEAAMGVLLSGIVKPVRTLSVSCFNLAPEPCRQIPLFDDEVKKKALTKALDTLVGRWGQFVIVPGRMMSMEQKVVDRIAFGAVSELDDVVYREQIEKVADGDLPNS